MPIRDATPDDASVACAVLRASIAELCMADHGNDPALLARWLGNETPENIAVWTQDACHSLLVAIEGETHYAVGSVRDSGEINMNYVAPTARFHAVSMFSSGGRSKRGRPNAATRAALFSATRRPTAAISHVATAMTVRRSESPARAGDIRCPGGIGDRQ